MEKWTLTLPKLPQNQKKVSQLSESQQVLKHHLEQSENRGQVYFVLIHKARLSKTIPNNRTGSNIQKCECRNTYIYRHKYIICILSNQTQSNNQILQAKKIQIKKGKKSKEVLGIIVFRIWNSLARVIAEEISLLNWEYYPR